MTSEHGLERQARFLAWWEVEHFRGPVVAVDVLRAFTTAAYAFAGGARAIYLTTSVQEALAFKARQPHVLAMGEERGRRPNGFDLSNSPVAIARTDLKGQTLVQCTSAGTRGALAATEAARVWCASLVCASATARAVASSGLGTPAYVITGRFKDALHRGGDDLAVARYIERARLGFALAPDTVSCDVASSEEAHETLAHGDGDVHAEDVAYATRVDIFDFAMMLQRTALGRRLVRVDGVQGQGVGGFQ